MLKLIQRKAEKIVEKKRMDALLEAEDFLPVQNKVPEHVHVITFVIPGMFKFSGGYTSILRLGTCLAKAGFTIYYAATSLHQSVETMKKNASVNLADYQGTFIKFEQLAEIKTDIVIATYWRTVYQAKKTDAYKMYFVQDYEPYFFQYGEQFLLAKKTYDMGYHMVCLGNWNRYMIEHECGKKKSLDVVEFPFEPKEYLLAERKFELLKEKKSLTIAAFIKEDGKRIPNIIINMMFNLQKQFETVGVKLNVKFFGIDQSVKIKTGENLGKLNKAQLLELYREADFGISASMTNISLVPYEMLATGLPLIEFQDGTFPFFFPEGSAVLTGYSYKELFDKIMNLIEHPQMLYDQQQKALKYLKSLSWQKTGQQFVDIVNHLNNES